MENIKSSFSKNAIYHQIPFCLLIIIVAVTGGLINLVEEIRNIVSEGFFNTNRVSIILIVCFGLPLFIANVLKVRYYVIGEYKMQYYSFFHPFGKTLYFEEYIGKIVLTETGKSGSYKVVYLVDKNNRTVFKIMGLHYKKFGEIINAIPLKQIDFSPTRGQYFRLLFFERITIEENGVNQSNDSKVKTALRIIQVFAIIGSSLFAIGTLIKMLTKSE